MKFERQTFEFSRNLEYFNEKELTLQIGCSKYEWPIALIKELIDNALDACENNSILPSVSVTIDDYSFTVQDNGPGLPESVIQRSLNYISRISSNAYYVSPTRGQLGNALKCLWAAAYVRHGYGFTEVDALGLLTSIEVKHHPIKEEPQIFLEQSEGLVKNGTKITVKWPDLASSYFGISFDKIYNLLSQYAAFNPHADVALEMQGQHCQWERTTKTWKKWLASNAPSIYWYNENRFESFVKGTITNQQITTIREFVAQFQGLSSTAKQKQICSPLGLTGQPLTALMIQDEAIDHQTLASLKELMEQASSLINPERLGVLGKAHMSQTLQRCGAKEASIEYFAMKGLTEDFQELPYVLEIGFGVMPEDASYLQWFGLNFSATIKTPSSKLNEFLSYQCEVNPDDPVALIIHYTCPVITFTDRGKSMMDLPGSILTVLLEGLKKVTQKWTKYKKRLQRQFNSQARQYFKEQNAGKVTTKNAAYQVMEQAYLYASSNNTLPANARQIMYAARPMILEITGRSNLDSQYFTQTVLPDFLKAYPTLTEDWDVVYDDRGHFYEPYTGHQLGLGTLSVRSYKRAWRSELSHTIEEAPQIAMTFGTSGPKHRYSHVLFIEKEGFYPLLERAEIAEKYGIAIMSTKGMSTTAARTLIEELSAQNVTILVAHDFDKAGFSIFHTSQADTRRYEFKKPPNVIDIGLRLEDVEAMDLQSEPVIYGKDKNPMDCLRKAGATEAECNFLVTGKNSKGEWRGQRVELNAVLPAQFVRWLEEKLNSLNVSKVIPDEATLKECYQTLQKKVAIQKIIDEAFENLSIENLDDAPADLMEQVKAEMANNTLSWDAALVRVITEIYSH